MVAACVGGQVEGSLDGFAGSQREKFPFFRAKQGAYLDSAATSQKPDVVIDAVTQFLKLENSNIHRGAYAFSANATQRYEDVRENVARFINAKSPAEVVFTRGTTESVNLVAHALEDYFEAGDVILLSILEHHSNIVPWELLAKRKGLRLEFIPCESDTSLDLDRVRELVTKLSPKLLAITHVSNAFGTVVPVGDVIEIAHGAGAKVLVDAAQSVLHCPIDVQELDTDFLVFSGHKMYGPTGVGVLYGKLDLLESMNPFLGGGGMIGEVTISGTSFAPVPQKFEAGTPPIAEVIGLGAAISFIEEAGFARIVKHEARLISYAFDLLSSESDVVLYGPGKERAGAQAGIIAFNIGEIHPHDTATIADSVGVQVRAGHHCAMPALSYLGIPSSVRASFGLYTTVGDVDRLLTAIRKTKDVMGAS